MSGIRLTDPYIYLLELNRNISNFNKGECYIGKHCGSDLKYLTSGTIPLNLINKYGSEIFDRSIIHQGEYTIEELNTLEKLAIEKYNSCRPITGVGLNLTIGGDGVTGGILQGIKNPSSKLKPEEVESILLSYKQKSTLKELSDKFSVSTQCIYRIISGKTWKHIRIDIDREELKKMSSLNKKQSAINNSKKGRLKRRTLTNSQIKDIRAHYEMRTMSIRNMAEKYNLSPSSICDIIYRRSYKNIT